MFDPFPNIPHRFTDKGSGMEILELVPESLESSPLSYDWPAFTPDNQFVIIRCSFPEDSSRPSGFYRVKTDGSDLLFLENPGIHPRLTPDGRYLYCLRHHDPLLRRVEVSSGQIVEVADMTDSLPPGWEYVQMRLQVITGHMFVHLRQPDIVPIRVNLESGEAVRMEDIEGMLWACTVGEPRVIVIRMRKAKPGKSYTYSEYRRLEDRPGDRSIWSVDIDGDDPLLMGTDCFSHATMLGRSSKIQGCGKSGDNAITI